MSKKLIVTPIQALQDNYIWLLTHPSTQHCVVVDPGDATPVLQALKTQSLSLSGILITHHHWDHTGGIETLVQYAPGTPVYGFAQEPIQHLNHPLTTNQSFNLDVFDLDVHTLSIPGHTLGHIAYHIDGNLFCGDTLFTAGCGRLFEGTAEQMLHSLNQLKKLPPETRIYCGHEYTEANLRFALTVEPENLAIQHRIKATALERARQNPTVPSTLALELQTNPFLRTHVQALKQSVESKVSHALRTETEVFAALRQWKDHF
jgi:hydroxyacylglutathione hydrolase